MTEYKCLTCVHLKPKYDLMECKLQVVRYLKEDKSSWTFDPTCVHDAEVTSMRRHMTDGGYSFALLVKTLSDQYCPRN